MASKCEICGKSNNTAKRYRYRGTYVTKRTKRVQHPNVRKLRIIENGTHKKVNVCSRCVRSGKVVRAV